MQLPESVRPFSVPTLIAVTDSVQAKLFRAVDNTMELLTVLSVKTDDLPGERQAVKTGAGDMRSGEPEDHRKEWTREKLYEALSTDLHKRLQLGEYEELAITVPEEHKNELEDTLHIDVLKRVVVTIPKLLTNEEPLDLAMHIQDAR